MYFLRTSSGIEADVVVGNRGRLDLYEIKAASTYHSGMSDNLLKIAGFVPETGCRTIVYSGRTIGETGGLDIVNFAEIPLD